MAIAIVQRESTRSSLRSLSHIVFKQYPPPVQSNPMQAMQPYGQANSRILLHSRSEDASHSWERLCALTSRSKPLPPYPYDYHSTDRS